jgi:uncharacterized protein YfaS (alpha-2-macroglobulin family)
LFGKNSKTRGKIPLLFSGFLLSLLLHSLLTGLVLTPQAEAAKKLSVSSFIPSGLIRAGEPIRIVFSSAVISSEDVGRTLGADELPISIKPSLRGYGRWEDVYTFIFSPSYINDATSYIATINNDLSDIHGNKLSGKREYEFFTQPLEFMGVRQTNFNINERYIDYDISFSSQVSASKLRDFFSVNDAAGASLGFSLIDGESQKVVRVRVGVDDGSPIEMKIDKGFTPLTGPLGLKETVSVKINRDLSLKVLESNAETYYGESSIYLYTTSNIDINKAASFIHITPKRDVRFESYGSSLKIIGDFKPRDRITVLLKKGLPTTIGPSLTEDWSRSFIFPDAEPQLSFQNSGHFISPAAESLTLPISTINIEKLKVDVRRVYDNNVSYVMLNGWPYYIDDLAENVSFTSYAVESKPNELIKSALDLKKITGDTKGLFTVAVSGKDYWPNARETVNITDIAGTIKFSERNLMAWANSIAAGKPLSGVKVTVYSKSNQILAEGTTNAKGVWTHKRNTEWEGTLRPHLAVFSKNKDTSILMLDNGINQMYKGYFSGTGYQNGAYRVLCYTPRGVFRPGENVPIFLLFREKNQSVKEPFPVQLKIKTPDGRVWKESTVMLSPMGMASSVFLLSDAAPTGVWAAEVYIPGEGEHLAVRSFLVEDFAPPRINVTVSSDKKELFSGESGSLNISSSYLFGSPSDGLNYEVTQRFISREYSNQNWLGYVFADSRISFSSESSTLAQGTLSATGDARVSFTAPRLSPPSVLDAYFESRVMQDNGRWVYKTLSMPYYPRNTLLGIKLPDGDISTGTPISFAFAAITPDGEGLSSEAALSVFKVEYRWITTKEDGKQRTESVKEFVPVKGFEGIDIKFDNGKASADITLSSYGNYLVELENSDGTASQKFFVADKSWGYGDSAPTLTETLEITLDKNAYKPGEKARARVSGNFDGTVLLSVETDETLHYEIAATKEKHADFTWNVTDEMSPNSWVTAHLVRPAASREQIWSAHRAYFAVPLQVDMSDHVLSLDITAPKKLMPSAKNEFSVKLTDKTGKGVAGEVTLMLVDDGVLDLTRFETPDPFLYFSKRRALGMFVYDVYDQLIPLLRDNLSPLKPGGGYADEVETRNASLSPVRAKRFEVLTLWKRVVTNNAGKANFSFVLPEFSGRARLMAVAASKNAYGSGEKFFTVSRNVVVEHSLPRAAAPGDSFESPIMLFNRTGTSLDIDLDLRIDGPISIAGERAVSADMKKSLKKRFTLPKSDKAFVIPLLLNAEASGVSKIAVSARYAGETTSISTEIPIRPPFPRISRSGGITIKSNDAATIKLPGGWMNGTRRAVISMSGLPQVGIADAASFLINYPYGCLEQTTSSGWGILSQPDLVSSIDPNLATHAQLEAALTKRIAILQSMQNYNGSFSMWPGSGESRWPSIYATHFLVACEKRGVPVPKAFLDSAMSNLRQMISTIPEGATNESFSSSLGQRAYASYVISLKESPPLAWMSYLRDNITSIPVYGRYFLGAAYARAGEKGAARTIIGTKLPAIAPQAKLEAEMPDFDSSLRNLALYLLAWNEIDPSSPDAAMGAAELLNSLKMRSYFTTQELGFALPALADFYAHNDTSGAALLELLSQDGKSLAVTSKDRMISSRVSGPIHEVTVKNSGTGIGYVSWVVDGVPLKAPPAEDMGLRVRVEYTDSKGVPLHAAPSVKLGQRLFGKITLEPFSGEVKNIVVVLPFAGGLEIENPRLMDQTEGDSQQQNVGTYGGHYEMRDDRLLLFLESIRRPYTWTFSMRAVSAGKFILPPIAAEGMYSPGIRSTGVGSLITIKEQ